MTKLEICAEIDNAIDAHSAWKLRLRSAINLGKSSMPHVDACRDDLCAFGTWLGGDSLDAETRQGMPYKVVSRLHSEFHILAGSVLKEVEIGSLDTAKQVMNGEFSEKSQTLTRALLKWQGELRG